MDTLRVLGDSRVAVGRATRGPLQPGDVVIRTAVSAICGSEMRSYREAGHPQQSNSGHEAAGEIVEVGAGVRHLQVGDRVGVSAIVGCGACVQCKAGRYTWCTERSFISGMHAEYITIVGRACHLLPREVDWATGLLISGDGLGVPFHSLTKFPTGCAETVAVVGLGPVGLGAVLLHAHLGRRVIGVDVSKYRLALATELGAAAVIEASADLAATSARIREASGGLGPDVGIEAAGTRATLRMCIDSVRTGGTVILNGEQPAVELSPSQDIIRRDLTISGAWFYHFHEFDGMLALVRDGLVASRLVTHRFALAQAQSAFQSMAAGATGKVLFEYPGF